MSQQPQATADETYELFCMRVQHRLEQCLQVAVQTPSHDQYLDAQILHEAMAYSLLNGGKRIRAQLVIATCEAIALCSTRDTFSLAAAVECIHAYSLVHDDLPAMDDDALRRGKPTNHIQFGEANAILAGDALQTLAFEIICDTQMSATQQIEAVRVLSHASGAKGMVGGQFFDLASETKQLTQAQLEALHHHKTGALIAAAIELGAIAANASPQQRHHLKAFGFKIGLAFQVIDDILDIEGDTETLGKTQGADIAANKATYPALMGLAKAKQYAHDLKTAALQELQHAMLESQQLYNIAQFITQRNY